MFNRTIKLEDQVKKSLSNYKGSIAAFSLLLVYFSFRYFFEEIISKVLVDSFFSHFKEWWFVNFIWFSIVLLTFGYVLYQILNKYIPTINGIVIYILTVSSYLIYRIFIHIWNFDLIWQQIAYTDIFPIIGIWLIPFKKAIGVQAKEDKNEIFRFHEDQIKTFGHEDLLDRQSFAFAICDYINKTLPDNAFAIGITGNYGDGKTVFLNQLMNQLSKEPGNLIIEFNPWLSPNSNTIIIDYFKSLKSHLKKYKPGLSNKFDTYATELLELSESSLFKILKSLKSIVYERQTLKQQYKSINDSIAEINKRIIVFIDDVDRLNNQEIFEVLRIVRNSASFCNTIFIVAYDRSYVLNALRLIKTPNYERYIDKIFQLEIPLQMINKSVINRQLRKLLYLDAYQEDKRQEIEIAILVLTGNIEIHPGQYGSPWGVDEEDYISFYLSTLRDAIRFSNSFLVTHRILGEYTDIIDLMLLDLIKIRTPEIYRLISQKYFIKTTVDTKTNRLINQVIEADLREYLDKSYLSHFIRQLDISSIIKSLKYLFNLKSKATYRALAYPSNFELYFGYQNKNLVPFGEFTKYRRGDLISFLHNLDQWVKYGKEDLQNIFSEMTDFDDKDDFEKMVKAMFHLSQHDFGNWELQVFTILNKVDKIVRNYYNNQIELYKAFIEGILNAGDPPYLFESAIAFNFLYAQLKENISELIFTRFEWQKIVTKFLVKYIVENRPVNNNLFRLYYNCYDHIESGSNKVILLNRANEVMLSYVTKPENALEYIRILPRSKFVPSDSITYVLEPFIPQTFGSWNNFEMFLYSLDANDPCVAIIIKVYAEYVKNNYEYFTSSPEELKVCSQTQP